MNNDPTQDEPVLPSPEHPQASDTVEKIAPRVDRFDATARVRVLRFLTDHNVPDSVGNLLVELGCDVVRLRDVMAVDTSDPVVAKAAMEDRRVLISWDRDFNQQRFKSPRFSELSRLSMSGPEMEGAGRLGAVFDLVEFALRRAGDLPITIHVGSAKIQIHV